MMVKYKQRQHNRRVRTRLGKRKITVNRGVKKKRSLSGIVVTSKSQIPSNKLLDVIESGQTTSFISGGIGGRSKPVIVHKTMGFEEGRLLDPMAEKRRVESIMSSLESEQALRESSARLAEELGLEFEGARGVRFPGISKTDSVDDFVVSQKQKIRDMLASQMGRKRARVLEDIKKDIDARVNKRYVLLRDFSDGKISWDEYQELSRGL